LRNCGPQGLFTKRVIGPITEREREIMGIFKGVEEATYNEGGIYFLDGTYLVKVDTVKVIETRKKDDAFIVEHTILWSDNSQRKKGTSVTWMTMKKFDSFLGNVKHFCSVASDTPIDEVTEEGIEMIVSDENPLSGTVLFVQATTVKTREGNDFTKVVYRHITPKQVELLAGMGIEVPDDNPINEEEAA